MSYNVFEPLREIPRGFSSPTLILVSPDLKVPASWESNPMITCVSIFALNIRKGGTLLMNQIEHVVLHYHIDKDSVGHTVSLSAPSAYPFK
jgi:hypothetical protein